MNLIIPLGLILLQAQGLLGQAPAKPAEMSPTALGWRGALPPGGLVGYITPNTKIAKQFGGGAFGMPYVLGPLTDGASKLHLLRRGFHQEFEKEGLGWRFLRSTPLPPPPSLPKAQPGQDPETSMKVKEAVQDGFFFNLVGYQVDETGTLYWVDRFGIARRTDKGWEPFWTFPEDIQAGRTNNWNYTHCFILPGQRWAVVGGRKGFLEVLDFSERTDADSKNAKDPKQVFLISHSDIGECPETITALHSVPFCVVPGFAYFHAGGTGRTFRFNLNSGALHELSSTWPTYTRGTQPSAPRTWQNTSGRAPSNPILPHCIAFSPSPEGTLHARALMYNASPALISAFDLSYEGSSLHPKNFPEDEMPNPLVLPNAKGDLIPIREMTTPLRSTPQTVSPSPNPASTSKTSSPSTL